MNLGKDMEKIIYKDTAGLGQNKFYLRKEKANG